MGLCPSRNPVKHSKFVDGTTYQPTPAPVRPGLRADAAEFVPAPQAPQASKAPAAWEQYLIQKNGERLGGPRGAAAPFARRRDGTYTSGYRDLLKAAARAPQPRGVGPQPAATGEVNADVLQSWKECSRGAKPKRNRRTDPLRAAVQRAREEKVVAAPQVQDDGRAAEAAQRRVPFGLADRHYHSGSEDAGGSHVHCSRTLAPRREYVDQDITADLEEALTEVLYKLRILRDVERSLPDPRRRYCVGLREVMRATRERRAGSGDPRGALRVVIVAPDVEREGGVDEKLHQVVHDCRASGTPVVFGLSRRRLGQAIKKSVTVSVLGILDSRGVEEPLERLLALAR